MDKNKAMPVITCIMFTYNHFDRIYESLDSVFAQDYPNIELGVFDDCSKNFPAQKIKDYINERKKSNIIKVKVVQNEVNLGTVKNINNAERQFEGKYIINLSPEDPFASSDVMRKIVDKMEELNSDVITTYRIIVDGNGKTVGKSPSERYFNKFIGIIQLLFDQFVTENRPQIVCAAGLKGHRVDKRVRCFLHIRADILPIFWQLIFR